MFPSSETIMACVGCEAYSTHLNAAVCSPQAPNYPPEIGIHTNVRDIVVLCQNACG